MALHLLILLNNILVQLSHDLSSDEDNDNNKPSGKGKDKSSGKNSASKRGNQNAESFFDCYGMDVAPLNLFENQVIPVRMHNTRLNGLMISKKH